MEELFALRPGRYRHFKGNEYELLYCGPPLRDSGADGGLPGFVWRAGRVGASCRHVERAGRPGRLSWPPFSVDRWGLGRGLTACKNIFQDF